MTSRRPPPPPPPKPLAQWGSAEISDYIRNAPRNAALPEPGLHRHLLVLEDTARHPHSVEGRDWTDTAACPHQRDAAMPCGAPAVSFADLDRNRRRILRLLARLDTLLLPDGMTARMCVNRRRLRASAEKLQELHRMGLVNCAGSRDAWGTGNTAGSSWWWLTTHGMRIVGKAGRAEP